MAKKTTSDFIDFRALLRQYTSKWYLFVISVIVCCALAFVYTRIKQPEYAVRANLLITTENDPLQSKLGDFSSLFGSDASVDDEIFIVSSHSLYRDVVRNLGINTEYYVHEGFLKNVLTYPNVPLKIMPENASMLDTLSLSLGFKIKVKENGKTSVKVKMLKRTVLEERDLTLPCVLTTPVGKFTVATTSDFVSGEDLTVNAIVRGYDAAAEDLDQIIHTEIASKRSNVITLGINTTNSDFGKAVLDEVLAQYNARGIVEKNNQATLTQQFLDDRLALISKDLDAAELDVLNYKQAKGIFDVVSAAKYDTEKKGLIEQKLIEAQTQAEIIELTRRFINDPANAYALIPMVVDNEGLQKSIESFNTLALSRVKLQKSALPDNLALQQLSEQIDLMRDNINSGIESALQKQQIAVSDLRRELASTEGSLNKIPETERDLVNLNRQRTIKSTLYMYLLQRREENAMILANAVPKGQIIDRAYTLSEPLGMGKKAILLIGFFLGLIIPPFWLYIRKLFHNRFETRQDVERITDVPIIGEMCVDSSGRQLVVSSDATDASAELFRLMRSNLLFVLNDPKDKVVLLTSSSSGEGKSFISINLAASLCLLGKRVVLVGMDIRNPRLAEYLGMHPRFGLTQYLSSSAVSLDQIIEPMSGIEGMDVIAAGPVPPNPAELLISPKVDELFKELRSRYDYVIVDTAPIGLVSDTFTLDRLADAAIYVCRANYTSLNDLELVNDIYNQQRLKKLSLVINGTAAKKTYGYGHKKSRS